MDSSKTWIGLAHVKPLPGNDLLKGALGAHVNVVGLAQGVNEFASAATQRLNAYEFEVLEIEDIELLDQRLKHFDVATDILELATGLTASNPIALSCFHSYDSE